MRKTILLFMFLFLMLISNVLCFTFTETFSGSIITAANFLNKSVSGTMYMNVSSGILNIYGNASGGTGWNGGVYITSKDYINITSNGELIFTFTIPITFSANQYFLGGLVPVGWATGSGGIMLTAQGGDSLYILDIKTGLRACGGSSHSLDNSPHIFRITATRDNGINTVFNTYYDGVLWCSVTQTSTINNLFANLTSITTTGNVYHWITIDNLYFSDNQSVDMVGFLDTGAYCDNPSDCLSGNCEYHRCALKMGNKLCSASSECLSGSCVNSHCGATDIWTSVIASKNQMFGNSDSANNFVSLFLIMGGAFGLGFATGGVLLPIIWIVMTTFGFTLFGMLSPFILVGLVLIGLVVIVLGVTIASKG